MTQSKFSIGKSIVFGWETMKKNIGFFILIMVIYIIVYAIMSWLSRLAMDANVILGIIVFLIYIVIVGTMVMGFIKISLRFCDEQKPVVGDLFSQWRLIIKYIIASIIFHVIVVIGLFLFIIPGVIWCLKFFFYDYFIVDRQAGIFESLQKSAAITKGSKWELYLLLMILFGIGFLGLLHLLVGIVFAYPIVYVAYAYAFRSMLAAKEEEQQREPQPADTSSAGEGEKTS